ncbi:hypothetical protein SRHO_G00316560 [Serrasalmus rhombeus]
MEKNGVTLNSKEEETPTRTKEKEQCGEDWWSPAGPRQGRTGELESCRKELVCSGEAQLKLYKEESMVLSVRKLLMDRQRQEGEQISVLAVELCTVVQQAYLAIDRAGGAVAEKFHESTASKANCSSSTHR